VQLAHPGYQLAYRRGYYADDAKEASQPAVEPLSRFLGPGMPASTQIPFTLRVTRGAVPAKPAASDHAPVGNPGQGGDNPNLKGAHTRYRVDFMIPADGLRWRPAPDGHRRVNLEAALMVYNHEGKAVNWMLRQINLNPDAAHYTLAQTSGVNLYLEIDAPDDGVSLRGGIYDLNAQLAGTLEIPLSAVLNTPVTTSSR
jgi:hypothetical protein